MASFDLATLVLSAFWGLVGGALFIIANQLLTSRQYLSALEHALAGAIAGFVAVFVLGFAAPLDAPSILALLGIGFTGVTFVDQIAEKIGAQATPAPAAAPKA